MIALRHPAYRCPFNLKSRRDDIILATQCNLFKNPEWVAFKDGTANHGLQMGRRMLRSKIVIDITIL